jgi:hypothetical protein
LKEKQMDITNEQGKQMKILKIDIANEQGIVKLFLVTNGEGGVLGKAWNYSKWTSKSLKGKI